MVTSNGNTKSRACKVEGCLNPPESRRSACQYHLITCPIAGCESKREGRKHCKFHDRAIHRFGLELGSQGLAPCFVSHCTAIARAGEKYPMCDYHQATCSHIECENPRDNTGTLCGMHSSRKRRSMLASSGPRCNVSGCNCPVDNLKQGLCQKHLVKLRRYGDAEINKGTPNHEPLEWLKMITSQMPLPNTCIEWPYNYDVHGYGSLTYKGHPEPVKAHRASLALYEYGSILKIPNPDVQARHLCPHGHNTKCINPLHLAWGTHAENMADKIANRKYKPLLSNAKLNEAQVIEILLDTREPEVVALGYPVTKSHIVRIKNRIRWAHVKLPADYRADQ